MPLMVYQIPTGKSQLSNGHVRALQEHTQSHLPVFPDVDDTQLFTGRFLVYPSDTSHAWSKHLAFCFKDSFSAMLSNEKEEERLQLYQLKEQWHQWLGRDMELASK
jgi:hypothetical protein